jgi:uncharacterized integral membrane protein (TIGR00697 family)
MSKTFQLQSRRQGFRCLDIITAFFVVILVVSNIASSAKIVDLRISLGGFLGVPAIPLAFDGGTLLFPLVYVLGSVVTEVYGFKAARRIIWTGFAVLAFVCLFFALLSRLPAELHWEGYAGTDAYNAILGGISTGGIAAASLAGYLVGKFFNTAIHSRLKVLMQGRALWFRAIGSSAVGELLDTFAFVTIATLAGVFGWELFATLVLTNYLCKIGIEVLIFPATMLIIKKLKKIEGIDTYDVGVKLNPFG